MRSGGAASSANWCFTACMNASTQLASHSCTAVKKVADSSMTIWMLVGKVWPLCAAGAGF